MSKINAKLATWATLNLVAVAGWMAAIAFVASI